MPRKITLRIVGDTATKSQRRAGIVGEGNVTGLVCTFDGSWDGFEKSLTFWDAEYANPVKILLTEAVRTAEREYTVLIPAEPLAKAGSCYLTVDGATANGRARTVVVEFEVEDAPVADDASLPGTLVPTQAEQLSAGITSAGNKAESAIATATDAKRIAEEAKELAEAGEVIDPTYIEGIVKNYLEENPPAPGEKGDTGPQGPQGEAGKDGETGPKGDPGYTPVRGTDYWTEADIAEIKSYVDDAILGGAW